MKKILILLLLAGFFAVISSCKKDANMFTNVSATVIYTGDLAADGCGYLIKIDSTTYYHPVNLDDSYKKDQLQVTINYHLLTTKYQCGQIPSNGLSEINISSITVK
ncbi:MAG: hypothetical protein ACRYFB_15155 [Janthinobacterium lividum]